MAKRSQNNNKAIWLIGGGIALFLLIKKMKSGTPSTNPGVALPAPGNSGNTSPQKQLPAGGSTQASQLPIAAFPLEYGSIGQQVAILQGMINNYFTTTGESMIEEDGKWGDNTNNAIAEIVGHTPVVIDSKTFDLITSYANHDNPLADALGFGSNQLHPTGAYGNPSTGGYAPPSNNPFTGQSNNAPAGNGLIFNANNIPEKFY